MTTWANQTPAERIETVKRLAEHGLIEREIVELTGASRGCINAISKRNNIAFVKMRDRRLMAMQEQGASEVGSLWSSDLDRRRQLVHRRAAASARATRLAMFGNKGVSA